MTSVNQRVAAFDRFAHLRMLALLLFSLALNAALLLGQTTQGRVPARTLGPRATEGKELFSQVRGFRELSDGRLLVTDQTEKKIVLLDMAKQTATHLGRPGTGPGEYQSITDLFGMPGDTTLLFDISRGLDALVTIAPDMKLGEIVKMPEGVRASYIFGVDRSGKMYFPVTSILQAGQATPDSSPLLRVDLRRKVADTALFLRSARRVAGVPANPYNPRDQWAVAPNGAIAIVNVDEYQVTWVAPNGTRKVGARLPFERIPVTQQDQDEFRELARRIQGVGISGASASGNPSLPATLFPDFKPPFFGNAAVQIAPNGELWVRRAQRIGEKRPLHDIIDADGKLVATITLPAETKLLALGTHGIYLARYDQDDLIHIERYAYPARG